MATLILSAVGTAFGGPLGGAIGALVGQQFDAAIIGRPTREGPRLKDLAVQTSSYGAPLPLHFGTMRAAGTVIWATDLVEHRETQGGGKRGPSVTSYTYTASFAVALASRPIAGIGRIWADGNLLRGAAGDLKAGGTLRIYTGEGDQQVDPLIAQAEGAGRCPAFRHLAYAVFEDLELADFGNRLPSLSFEVFADPQGTTLEQVIHSVLPGSDAHTIGTSLGGFSIDGGSAGNVMAALSDVYGLTATVDGERLSVSCERPGGTDLPVIAPPAAGGASADALRTTGWNRLRDPQPPARQTALRYYDPERDYQPGLQRSPGRTAPGDVAVSELPAALSAAEARELAAAIARRLTRPTDRIRYRIGTIDPAIRPGCAVRVPVADGIWLVESWEWQKDGVLLDLRAIPGAPALPSAPVDAGRANLPADVAVPPTVLVALELPWDGGSGTGDQPALFAAASGANAAWRGAALFARQPGGALASLGTAPRRRAVVGRTLTALPSASPHLLDLAGKITVKLAGADLGLYGTDLTGLLQGANRARVGDELIQFSQAHAIGDGRYVLSQFLRGRGGTEWAMGGHVASEPFVLLDDALVPLSPAQVGDAAVARVIATGLGDAEPAESEITGAGATQRPFSPVHPALRNDGTGGLELTWVRRARGIWSWSDFADVPLNEAAEVWDVTYGLPAAPSGRWRLAEPRLVLDSATVALLQRPGRFEIRQVGSASASPVLVVDLPA